jgi:uncharacterized protein YhaN
VRIERVELDGFGRFSGEQWTLNEGITVLYGANEAGKTTLLNGIRALLFGFESTREGRTWYPAFAGGRRGGRLWLLTRDGERWTVDRHGDRGGTGALVVEAPNGNRGGQDELNRLLGNADRDLFNNIFAFGLGELEAFTSLSGEGVRSRIYGAGSGLGGTSVVDIERRLRSDQEALYKPRGQEQVLARLLSQMEELRTQIGELEQQPAEYEAARVELAEVQQRHQAARSARMAVVERGEHLRRLLEAQAPAGRLSTLQAELGETDPRLDDLAPDAVSLLDRLVAAEREAEGELRTLDGSIASAERRRQALAWDERVLDETSEIEALRDERLSHEARAALHAEAAAATTRLDAELQDQLRRVGGWTEEQLLGVDDSIATVEQLRELEARLGAARQQADRLEERLTTLRGEAEGTEDGAPDPDIDAAQLAARGVALDALAELRIEVAALEERERLGTPRHGIPPWLVAAGAAAILLLLGILAGDALGTRTVGALVGAAAGIGAAAWLIYARPMKGPAGDRAALLARRAGLLTDAGLPPDADSRAISAATHDLAAAQLALRSDGERRVRAAERAAALDRLKREAAAAGATQVETATEWRRWLAARGLPLDLSVEAARQVMAGAATARRLVRERDEQRVRAAAIAQAAATYDARLDGLLQRIGRPLPAASSLRPSTVVALAQEREQAAAEARRARDIDATIGELLARRPPLEAAQARATADLAAYLKSHGVSDPDELRRFAEAAIGRSQLRHAIRAETAALLALAGSEEALPALLAEARAIDPASLDAQRQEAIAEAARLETAESGGLTREGELRGQIGRLEHADELGTARQQLAVLQARAEEHARAWAVRAVALTLLAETRQRYERERQPQVVRDAERHFAAITDGRYARIVAPPGEADVRVEPEAGAARTTDQLSRGTAEQLYLALRFGLIEQFGRSAEPLPVVMDDILVNFDRERATRAARAIRDLATRHQVVFFTCHPQTAELLDPDGVATVRLG